MNKLGESKIVITKTYYDRNDEAWDSQYERAMMGQGEIIKIEVDGRPVFYRNLPDYLHFKRGENISPVDQFLDYIDLYKTPKGGCSTCQVSDQVKKCNSIISELRLQAIYLERKSVYVCLKNFFLRLKTAFKKKVGGLET